MRASLTQEVVRRLKNTSEMLPRSEIHRILSIYSQKIVNSGHSLRSAQYLLVHGVTKYIELIRRSQLNTQDSYFKPLHSGKKYDLYNRKLHKFLAKMSWYGGDGLIEKTQWRQKLPHDWVGSKPLQYCVPGMSYTTVFQVPNSQDGKLLKMLARAEPRIAKLTGYQTK